MPSTSAAQHRWIGYLHSNPEAAKKAGMSPSKVQEWLHADRGSPWKRASGGAMVRRNLMPEDQEFEELKNRGWHNYLADRRTGDPRVDPGMATASPHSRNDMEITRGAYGGLGGRTDYDPIPQGASGGGTVRRDDGGQLPDYSGGITGPTPTPQAQSPLVQGMIQKYSSMPTEQLTELAARLGGSQQGQMIQQLLLRRRMMPQTAPQPDQQQPASPLSQPLEKGGKVRRVKGGVPKRPGGGGLSSSEASPWWTRREASGEDSGFLHGSTPGRADQIKTQAMPGSYVVPADVVSGLGEGNSLAGAKAIQEAIASGPWGTPLPRPRGRSTIPHPPPLPTDRAGGGSVPIFEAKQRSKGGANTGNTPVDLSDGEFVVAPKDCERFGNGDRSAGHRWWDDWVLRKRKEHIEKLRKLPPPVKP